MSSTTTMAGRRTVVGVFDGPNHAEMALNELKAAGFTPEQVSVVARDNRETQAMVEGTGMGAEGAGTGAVLGGITGGVLGWLVGIGALAIPGIGPIVAAGALATTLGGAAIGAVAGGLIGALVDLGIPEEEARGYEESVRQGSILLTVNATSDEQAHQARSIFERHGGADVRAYGVAADGTYDTGPAGGPSVPRYDTSRDYDRTGPMGTSNRDDRSAGDEVGAAGGGAAGAVAGGVLGGAVGGPVGAGIGAAAGGATGAAAGHAAGEAGERDRSTSNAGPAVGGGTGAVVGGAVGSLGGPVGTAAGAAIGGAAGGAAAAEGEDKLAGHGPVTGRHEVGTDYQASTLGTTGQARTGAGMTGREEEVVAADELRDGDAANRPGYSAR